MKMPPRDLLLQYRKVFHLVIGEQGLISEVLKGRRGLHVSSVENQRVKNLSS